MPKERIYTQQPETKDQPGQHVHVQWGQGKPDINIGTVHDNPDGSEDLAYFVNVRSREIVNRMIRTLRRARDQAFGKDA